MKIETYPLGVFQANCYIIWHEGHVLIVDPGGSSKKLASMIEEADGIVDGIVLTHGHHDHIGGVDFFANKFKCEVYISLEDAKFFDDTKLNCSAYSKDEITVKQAYKEFDSHMQIGVFSFDVLEAPGHTNGSVLLMFDTFMLSGDVLFQQNIGRCDLPTGSNAKMSQTIQMIKGLEPRLKVYPGHGAATTMEDELKYNPYFN